MMPIRRVALITAVWCLFLICVNGYTYKYEEIAGQKRNGPDSHDGRPEPVTLPAALTVGPLEQTKAAADVAKAQSPPRINGACKPMAQTLFAR